MTDYTIDCTGDCCVGDSVRFERALFTGRYPSSKFAGNEVIEAVIINDSYGAAKQQHTFTLLMPDGTKTFIKGRNLYRNGVMRKAWDNEADRLEVLSYKHARGAVARADRAERRAKL